MLLEELTTLRVLYQPTDTSLKAALILSSAGAFIEYLTLGKREAQNRRCRVFID